MGLPFACTGTFQTVHCEIKAFCWGAVSFVILNEYGGLPVAVV